MKIETKRRILWFVKRVINYCEHSDSRQYIVIESKKLIKVKAVYKCPHHEQAMMSKEQLRYVLNMQLMDELEKKKLVKYSTIPVKEHVSFYAELNVLML